MSANNRPGSLRTYPRQAFRAVFSTVRGRIILSSACALLVFASIATFQVGSSIDQHAQIEAANHSAATAEALESAHTNGTDTYLQLLLFVFTGRDDLFLGIQQTGADTTAAIEEARRLLEAESDPDALAGFNDVLVQIEPLQGSLTEVVRLRLTGETDAATALLIEQMPTLLAVEESFGALAAIERDEVKAAQASLDRAADRDIAVSIIGGVAGLALIVALFATTVPPVIKSLGRLESSAKKIAAGDLDARAPETGLSETAHLGVAFNRMTEALLDASKRRELEAEREAAYQEVAAANDHLRESEERWRALLENSQDLVVVVDSDHTIKFINRSVEPLLGYKASDLVGTDGRKLVHNDDLEETAARYERVAAGEGDHQLAEARMRRADGSWASMEAATARVLWDGRWSILMNARDVTARKAAEERISYMAYHDALTDLPNRLLFRDRLDVAIAQARRSSGVACLLSIDLDRFKIINDTLGHAAGDQLLRDAAKRLNCVIREGDTLTRIGGDEFELLLAGCESVEDAKEVAERIVEAFRRPFELHGRTYHTTASVGISVCPDDGHDAEVLLRNADSAMYVAKEAGRDNWQVYLPAMNNNGAEWLAIQSDLRLALEQDEIEAYFQPQVSIATGEVVGVEALARWRHPTRGLVSPMAFIPVAEETGLIVPLGEQMLRKACTAAAGWEGAGAPPLRLAVNVSYRQIQHPAFVEMVRQVLRETGLPPERLQLEITESAVLKDLVLTRKVAQELDDMGVGLSVDDFGSGSTSLRYLKEFPIRELKIDRSFIRDLPENPNNAAIANSVIALGHRLHLNVIAEGVETEEQLQFLRQHHCDEFQGFLHSEPMPADVLLDFIRPRAEVAV